MKDSPQLLSIFCEARERPSAEERAAYLDHACGTDADLRSRVEALLRAEPEVGSFLRGDASPPELAATVEDPISERPGTVIGPFKLLEHIGEGGFGIVFMAEQQQPIRRKVALKVLKPGMDTRQVIARFEAERQALALMDHPNIAKVLDAGQTSSGRPYFVMDLVKGIPITEYCDHNQLPVRERLELFVHVCQAVQHAHQKGIIHRDLKPTNVLVTMHDGAPLVKVIDFGIAKALGQQLTDKTLFTGFAQMIGTPLYMSPEQAALSNVDVDTRSDVYSLGVLLYEMLTGATPFDKERFKAAGYDEIRRIIREEEPPRPSTRLSTLGQAATALSAQRKSDPKQLSQLCRGELDWIVMKALEKDRNRRYETALDLAADIRRHLHHEPVLACPPTAWYRCRKFGQRNKVALAMTSLVALALVAVGVAGLLGYRNQLTEHQRLADQKAHEERLVAEQRQNALEKALLAAMAGDFEGAEKAIDEAELLGASTGQVRILRGQVALHRGEMDKALQHLEQAVKLLPVGQPGAVAARAMLALAYFNSGQTARLGGVPLVRRHAQEMAYFNSGQIARVEQLWQDLDEMQPSTPEDYLFKGQVEALINPEGGLQAVDEAIRRRNSVIARVVRTEVRTDRALYSGEARDAELALEDIGAARVMLPDYPYVLALSVYAQLVAAGIYEDQGRTKDRERVLEEARGEVRKLKQFTSLPVARKVCFWYFDYVGDAEAAFEMSGHGTEFRHVSVLYRRGDYTGALQAADRAVARGYALSRIERGFVMAELDNGPGRAQAAFQEAVDNPGESRFFQLRPPLLLLLLGKKEEAVRASLQVRQKPAALPFRYDDWYLNYLDYNCSLITEADLLKAAGRFRPKQCEAHFSIALHRLAEGDRAEAREQLRKCLQTHMFIFWDYAWARAFLKRLEKDPAWPPWIPLQK
jgi:serine/threonine protein kinase/tetratricopeptide (TPR) repeat protein